MLGFSNSEITAMYDDIVKFAELEDFMDQKLKNYSSGMKVRLAFSIAIRAKGDILILDEVLAVGDAAFQKKCNDYFASLPRKHKYDKIEVDSRSRTGADGILLLLLRLFAVVPLATLPSRKNVTIILPLSMANKPSS